MRFVLLAMILALPILEIATLIVVGRELGVLWTLALVFGAGALGVWLVRLQGLSLLSSIQRDIAAGRVPAEKILSGAAVVVAGLFFLLPGLLSDVIGLLLLLPPVRIALAALLLRNAVVVRTASSTTWRSRSRPGVVDLDEDDWQRKDGEPGGPGGAGGEPPLIGRDR